MGRFFATSIIVTALVYLLFGCSRHCRHYAWTVPAENTALWNETFFNCLAANNSADVCERRANGSWGELVELPCPDDTHVFIETDATSRRSLRSAHRTATNPVPRAPRPWEHDAATNAMEIEL